MINRDHSWPILDPYHSEFGQEQKAQSLLSLPRTSSIDLAPLRVGSGTGGEHQLHRRADRYVFAGALSPRLSQPRTGLEKNGSLLGKKRRLAGRSINDHLQPSKKKRGPHGSPRLPVTVR